MLVGVAIRAARMGCGRHTGHVVLRAADQRMHSIIGNHRHGFVMAIGDIAWTGMLLGLLFLIVGSATAIVRSRRRLSNN